MLVTLDNLQQSATVFGKRKTPTEQVPEQDSPSLGESLTANFARENTVGSAIHKAQSGVVGSSTVSGGLHKKLNTDFDPFDNIEGYEDVADEFIYANNTEEVDNIKGYIDGQRKFKDIQQRTGIVTNLLTGIAAGALDPISYILGPSSMGIKVVGKTIASTALRTAAMGGTGAAVQEFALDSIQTERTLEEAVVGVAGTTIFAGAVGTAIGAFSKGLREEGKAVITNAISEPGEGYTVKVNNDGSIGAAKVSKNISDEGLARINEKLAKSIGGLEVTRGPALRTVSSDSISLRSFGNAYYEHNFILGRNVKGSSGGPSVETLLKLDDETGLPA